MSYPQFLYARSNLEQGVEVVGSEEIFRHNKNRPYGRFLLCGLVSLPALAKTR